MIHSLDTVHNAEKITNLQLVQTRWVGHLNYLHFHTYLPDEHGVLHILLVGKNPTINIQLSVNCISKTQASAHQFNHVRVLLLLQL